MYTCMDLCLQDARPYECPSAGIIDRCVHRLDRVGIRRGDRLALELSGGRQIRAARFADLGQDRELLDLFDARELPVGRFDPCVDRRADVGVGGQLSDRPVAVAPTQAGQAALRVVETMIETYGRTGKLGGAGFYDYADGNRTRIWPELRAFSTPAPN